MAFVGQCKAYLVMFVGIFLGYGLIANDIYEYYNKQKLIVSPGSEFTIYWVQAKKFITTAKEYVYYYIKDMVNHEWNLILVIGLYILLLISAAITIRKCIKGDK